MWLVSTRIRNSCTTGIRIVGINVGHVLREIDRILIPNLLHEHHNQRTRERQGRWVCGQRLGQHVPCIVQQIQISQSPGKIDRELFSARSVP